MRISPIVFVAALLSSAAVAQAPSASSAMLRCDPGTLIDDIDGGAKSRYFAGEGSGFKECAIPLAPGPHVLKVCFSTNATATTRVVAPF